jgi:putative transcriptional regulator
MKKEQFDELVESVHEGSKILNNESKPSRRFEIKSNDIKIIRLKNNLSQDSFAKYIGISVETLKNWENGKRKPSGPANVLLSIAVNHPEVIFKNS